MSLWAKIWAWTKTAIFAAMVTYVVLFVLNNSGQAVNVWLFFGPKTNVSLLVLILFSFIAGILLMLVLRAVNKTLRQIREMRARSRASRLEREVANMKSKAAMLQLKTGTEDKPK
jgi:uncharacterized integral membrane protein